MGILITEHVVSIGKSWCDKCKKEVPLYLQKFKVSKHRNNTKVFCQLCNNLIKETNKLPDDMDKEVIPICNLLNRLKGIITIASCGGHGYSDHCFVTFTCTNFKSLKCIVDAVHSIHTQIYNGDNSLTDNWTIKIFPRSSFGSRAILAAVVLEPCLPEVPKIKVDTKIAWNKLEDCLKRTIDYKYPKLFNHPANVTDGGLSGEIYAANTGIVPWW